MFTLSNVSKRYGENYALQDINLQIPPAQTTIFIGPSGCGKSTLIRLLIGLIPHDSGEITFQETSLSGQNILEMRHRMGYVIQDGGLFPHLTARQNATIMARYLKWDQEKIANRLDDLRQLTHLPEDALERYPHELSGGQRQRVSLIRALMLDPEVLLLDEPLGALDPMIRADLQNELREIFQRLNKTVVMVTHDLGEAFFFGDQIVLMREGHIVQQGQFQELYHHPAEPFVTQFINAQRSPLEEMQRMGE